MLILECLEEENLPEKYRDKFVDTYNKLCELLDELDDELFGDEDE